MSAATVRLAWVQTQRHTRNARTRRATYRKVKGSCAQVIVRLHRLAAILVQCREKCVDACWVSCSPFYQTTALWDL